MQNSKQEFSARTRARNLHTLDQFDVLVVGGGITGAGIARDAALRGFKTALIDKGDFASGTSSKSSKLIHGGVRYLEMFDWRLVFEASRERRTLSLIAPALVKPMPFLFPVYKDARFKPWLIDLGLWLYDALALFRNYKRHAMFSAAEIARQVQGIDVGNIAGGAYYYDAQVDDARLTLETIRAAHQHGAWIANYVQVDALIKNQDRVAGVQAHDTLSGKQYTVYARIVVNATGPWTDTLLQLDDPRAPQRMRPTKGIHLVVPREKLGAASAVAFPSNADGRLLFVIPWGEFSLIGTTDTDYAGDFDAVHADAAEVAYILAATNHAFPASPLAQRDVISTYAGLRPLVKQPGKNATKTSREHNIWTSASGLMTITGGKLTTYRAMAQELVNLVAARLRDEFGVIAKKPCVTARLPLTESVCESGPCDLPRDVLAHLDRVYGPAAACVANVTCRDPRASQRVVENLPYIWAQVRYAMEHEMALTITDILARRMHILNESREHGLAVASRLALCLGEFLDWDSPRIEKELRAYQTQVELAQTA